MTAAASAPEKALFNRDFKELKDAKEKHLEECIGWQDKQVKQTPAYAEVLENKILGYFSGQMWKLNWKSRQ